MGSLTDETNPPFIIFSQGVKGRMHQASYVLNAGENCNNLVSIAPTETDGFPNPQRKIIEGKRPGEGSDLLLPAFQAFEGSPFGRVQIFSYDIDTPKENYTAQLITDGFQKRITFPWRDSSVQNGFVFLTLEAQPEIEKYKLGTCSDGALPDQVQLFDRCHQWTQLGIYTVIDGVVKKVSTIEAPDAAKNEGFTDFYSPEPFVFKGKSYIVTEIGNGETNQIWLMGLDFNTGNIDDMRRVDGGYSGHDPEALVRTDTVHIYFSSPKSQFTYRAETGL